MEVLAPYLIVGFSIAMAVIMLVKIVTTYKFISIREGGTHNLLKAYMMFAMSVFMIWFPVIYKGDNPALKTLSRKINWMTAVFYGVVSVLAVVIYFRVLSIQSSP
jgi:hypothetical protein